MALRFSRLTRPNIRSLKPGEKIAEHGIVAEREGDGDVVYSVNVMVHGLRVHRVVGRESDGTTRTQAEDYVAQVRTDAKHGRLSLPKGRSVPLTVKAACDLYIKAMKVTGGKNMTAKEAHCDNHITPYFKGMELTRVAPFTMRKFRKALLDKGLASATANRVGASWNHMARWLYDESKIDRPLPRMVSEKEQNHRDYVLSDADEKNLLEAAAYDVHPYVWLFCVMGLGSSMRHREILSGRFDRLDANRRRLRIKVKGGRERDQPLPQWLVNILLKERESAADPDGWIFPSARTKTGHLEQMNGAFTRCVKAAGLDPSKVSPHTMRHTALTRFAAVTHGDPATVKRYSGHLSLQALMRYIHPSDEHVDSALERVRAGDQADRVVNLAGPR
jgi:integrase